MANGSGDEESKPVLFDEVEQDGLVVLPERFGNVHRRLPGHHLEKGPRAQRRTLRQGSRRAKKNPAAFRAPGEGKPFGRIGKNGNEGRLVRPNIRVPKMDCTAPPTPLAIHFVVVQSMQRIGSDEVEEREASGKSALRVARRRREDSEPDTT